MLQSAEGDSLILMVNGGILISKYISNVGSTERISRLFN